MNGQEIISEIKTNIAVLETKFEERWINHDLQAQERQKATCNKLDIIVEEIGRINERCFNRVEDYTLLKEHLKNANSLKALWQDRNFKILLFIMGGGWIGVFTLIISFLKK